MAIKLHIISDVITSERMQQGIKDGFEKSTGDQTASIKARIDQLAAIFKDPITMGDVYDLVYLPAEGILVYKNTVLKSKIPGLDFKKALFGIWLGLDPADNSLKKSLLGN